MNDKKKRLVCKSNHLVEASYRLSLYEQRLILTAITQVRRDQPVTDAEIYYVTAADIAQQADIDVKSSYRHIQKAMKRLFERKFTATMLPPESEGEGALIVKKGRKRTFRWIQAMEEDAPAGAVGIRFSKDILPYLSQLKAQFTQYALTDVGKMSSAYGIRLYELLLQWQSRGQRTVSIEWLRQAFDLGDRHQALSDLKKIVIYPAVKQVNEHSPIEVQVATKKTNRRVTHFVFNFEKKADKKKRIAQEARDARFQQRLAELQAAEERKRQREAMKAKKPWEDAEHPLLPGEPLDDYFKRIEKIRGFDQPKPAATGTVATTTTADDTVATPRCKRTTDMFEAFNEGESK